MFEFPRSRNADLGTGQNAVEAVVRFPSGVAWLLPRRRTRSCAELARLISVRAGKAKTSRVRKNGAALKKQNGNLDPVHTVAK